MNTLAISMQVEEKAASLNSADCFVLLKGNTAYEWRGNGSTAEEKEAAKTTADRLTTVGGIKRVVVEEGKEPAAFWEALGGKVKLPCQMLVYIA
jgi:hypothetical protein